MSTLLTILTSGLLAALAMGVVGFFLQFLGIHRAEMITSVGSLFARDQRRAFGVGWLVHLVVGAIFGFIYAFVWSYFVAPTSMGFMTLGIITGFLHGLVVSIMLVIEIAEHHPDPKYRKIGYPIALSYIGTHVIYGIALGYLLGAFEQNFDTISHVAEFRRNLMAGR